MLIVASFDHTKGIILSHPRLNRHTPDLAQAWGPIFRLHHPDKKEGIAVPQKGKDFTCRNCSLGESRK